MADSTTRTALETVEQLRAENAAQADEITRLRAESARHRRNGLLRLMADLRKPDTLVDAAALSLAQMSAARGLPGHERPLDWFEDAVRRGCTDIGAV
jgi:hypothetical protein